MKADILTVNLSLQEFIIFIIINMETKIYQYCNLFQLDLL